jgi:hypothetical protein
VTRNDAYEFFVEHVSQLFHADVLITDQAERIEALEAEVARVENGAKQDGGRVNGRRRWTGSSDAGVRGTPAAK